MTEQTKLDAIQAAKVAIESRMSRGQVKRTLVQHFELNATQAGKIIRAAVRELYDSDIQNPIYWLLQDRGASTPLQRRFARRKYAQLTSGRG